MAKKKNIKEEEKVRMWNNRIQLAKNFQKKKSEEYRWNDYEREYQGKWDLDQLANDPHLVIPPINYIFAYVKTEIASMALKDPHFEISPKKESSVLSAKIRELALNYIWRQKRIKRETKKSLQDGKIVGHSWFKTGYTGQFGTVELSNGNVMEFIEEEDFFGYRAPYENILFNVDSIDPPFDCRWIAHEIFMNVDKVRENPLYSHVDEIQESSIVDISKPLESDKNIFFDDESMKKVKIYEVWDKDEQEVFTLAEGLDKFLEKPKKWPYEMRGFPFSYLRFNGVSNDPYGIPDVMMFEPQVMELIKLRAMQLDHLKRYNRQMQARKGLLDEEQKKNFALGLTGNLVETNGDGQMAAIPYPPIQADIYAVEERVKEDLVNVSGQSPVERGGFQKTTTRTIGELMQIQKGAQNRRSEQLDTYEDFLEDIGRNILSLIMQFADEPFYVKLTGDEPQEILQMLAERPSAIQENAVTNREGFTFTTEDIKGEFDIDVKIGSTIPLNRENKIQIVMSILEIIPKLGAIPGGPVIGALAKIISEELDMPEIQQAIQQEIEMQNQIREQQKNQLMDQQSLDTAKFGAEKQLEAEKIAQSSNRDVINLMTVMANRGDLGR